FLALRCAPRWRISASRSRMRRMMGCWWSQICAGLGLVLDLGTYAHAESSLDANRTRGLIRIGVKTGRAALWPPRQARPSPWAFEIDLSRFLARVLFDDDNRAQLVPVTTATPIHGPPVRRGRPPDRDHHGHGGAAQSKRAVRTVFQVRLTTARRSGEPA